MHDHVRPPLDWRRMLAWPLLALAAAAGVWLWTDARDHRRAREVHTALTQLVNDLRADESTSPLLDHLSQGPAAPAALDQLRDMLQGAPAPQPRIEVSIGDHPTLGDGSATHTASIRLDDTRTLVVRLAHRGAPDHITIRGYWIRKNDE